MRLWGAIWKSRNGVVATVGAAGEYATGPEETRRFQVITGYPRRHPLRSKLLGGSTSKPL